MKIIPSAILACLFPGPILALPLQVTQPQAEIFEEEALTVINLQYEITNLSKTELTMEFSWQPPLTCIASLGKGIELSRYPEIRAPVLNSLTFQAGETKIFECTLEFDMPEVPINITMYLEGYEQETLSSTSISPF